MLRTRFRHQLLKMKTTEAKAKYNQQRNICDKENIMKAKYM